MYVCMYVCMYVYYSSLHDAHAHFFDTWMACICPLEGEYVCMYVCIYVCMYVCVCVCITALCTTRMLIFSIHGWHVYALSEVSMYVCMCVYVYVCVYYSSLRDARAHFFDTWMACICPLEGEYVCMYVCVY